jgi:hypothetical protein
MFFNVAISDKGLKDTSMQQFPGHFMNKTYGKIKVEAYNTVINYYVLIGREPLKCPLYFTGNSPRHPESGVAA